MADKPTQTTCKTTGKKIGTYEHDMHCACSDKAETTPRPRGLTRANALWLADKIYALGDYAKEAAWMLNNWPHDSICNSWRSKGHTDCICDGEQHEE